MLGGHVLNWTCPHPVGILLDRQPGPVHPNGLAEFGPIPCLTCLAVLAVHDATPMYTACLACPRLVLRPSTHSVVPLHLAQLCVDQVSDVETVHYAVALLSALEAQVPDKIGACGCAAARAQRRIDIRLVARPNLRSAAAAAI